MYLLFKLLLVIFTNACLVMSSCPKRQMNCHCGRNLGNATVPRVVGGTEAFPHALPWMASLVGDNLVPFCGGSLINDRYILTAGHCLPNKSPENLKVLMGHHDLTKLKSAELYQVDKLITYPKYSASDPNQKFDLALLRLKKEVKFNQYISPVCLPGRKLPSTFDYLMIAGWGQLGEELGLSNRLQAAVLPEISFKECVRKLRTTRITPAHICAGNKYKDGCGGDSGGPLVTLDKSHSDRYTQVGITSWGIKCAHSYYPGVFTRVWSYADWINDNTKDARYCNNRKSYDGKDC